MMTQELLEEVKKYSAQVEDLKPRDDQTQNFQLTVGAGAPVSVGIDGERPVNDMQNMSGIGGISEIEYDE